MLAAAVSTLALALALGPHLHVSLQAAIEDTQPVAEETLAAAVEDTVETLVEAAPEAEPVANEAPAETVDRIDQPITETNVEETLISETEPESVPETVTTEAEPPATANSGQVPEAEWPAILDATSAALSAARTATGDFVQTNGDGSITTGTFALNRPGRMRFDYDDPTPILIVSNGTTVAMEDSELETVDRVPIGATPLGLILSTDLNVNDDVEVLSVMQNEDRVGIRVSDATGELEGTLTMVFDKTSYDLLGWLATDGNLQTTVVDLTDVETNGRVDPRLFRLDEDDDEDDER